MSRGRMTHNINASLIHEARMILQHFLTGREIGRSSMRFAKTKACTHTVLTCIFCLKDAKFVINGQSVCLLHEARARGASNRPTFPGE